MSDLTIKELEHGFAEELVEEQQFLQAIGKTRPEGMQTQLDHLVLLYNQMQNNLVCHRVDAELDIASGVHNTESENIKKLIPVRRATLTIVRRQILTIIGEARKGEK